MKKITDLEFDIEIEQKLKEFAKENIEGIRARMNQSRDEGEKQMFGQLIITLKYMFEVE